MTKTIITSYFVSLLLVAFGLIGVMFTHASEVVGVLSSDTANNSQTSDNISGVVTSGSNGGGNSSGGSRSGGGSSSANTPAGSVLGASIDNTQAPGFPNAGFAPEESNATSTYWSVLIAFIRNIVSSSH